MKNVNHFGQVDGAHLLEELWVTHTLIQQNVYKGEYQIRKLVGFTMIIEIDQSYIYIYIYIQYIDQIKQMITISLDQISQELSKDYNKSMSYRFGINNNYQYKKKMSLYDEAQPLQKLKKTKQQAQNAKKQLNQAIRKYQQLKKQIDRNQKLAHIVKLNCLKLYQVKKHRLVNKSLITQTKQRLHQQGQRKFENVKKLKLQQQYFRELIKNQQLYKRFQMRQQFSKYKLSVRQALHYKNKLFQDQTKQKYFNAKNSEHRHSQQKKLIESMISQRCKQNYIMKLQKQIRKIQAYNELMSKLQDQQKNALQGLAASKLFENKAHNDIQSFLKSQQKKQSFFITQRRQIKTAVPSRRLKKPI